ncbi:MAG: hypothetical protein BZ138_07915 [Methanosphaera sp. rholeuAM270]|nr:MAG: hypothetical protein BZ138_07915 [Methanosphaera sp. rholeuAM270]
MATNSEAETSYVTNAGVEVPKDGHSNKFMKGLQEVISDWVHDEGDSPDAKLSPSQLKYIEEHMEDSENNPDVPTGHLTRVEDGNHMNTIYANLKVGDKLPANSLLRSFSRDPSATLEYIGHGGGHVIILRTNGNIKHFNATKFDDYYDEEKESFVKVSNMKVDKIEHLRAEDYPDFDGDFSEKFTDDYLDNLGGIPDALGSGTFINEVTFIDISEAK